jgi:uncharacterized repeat protein (TIGR01451 family)
MPPQFAKAFCRVVTGLACALVLLAIAGCANCPWALHQSGGPPIVAAPAGIAPLPNVEAGVTLSPTHVVAPIGSDVVLVAGVRSLDGRMATGQRVEWMLAPDGAGQFITSGGYGNLRRYQWLQDVARKVDNSYAIGHTSARPLVLTHGTTDTSDDIRVQPGETWMSITSPTEGTSHVTVYAPGVPGWHRRHQSATIHWLDAQFTYPSPAIVPAGKSQVLTTTVTRQSDQSPQVDWIVIYEVSGGATAGFGEKRLPNAAVRTDASGKARVELLQDGAAAGVTQVSVQVIRPADARGGFTQRYVAGRGSVQVTWSSADLSLTTSGPHVATTGATITYRHEVTNGGDLPAKGVVLTDVLPAGLKYLRSNPTAEITGGKRQWRLGDLKPGETRTIEVDVESKRPGDYQYCATIRGDGGLLTRSCANTTISDKPVVLPRLDVKVSGPVSATVGGEAYFEVVIVNRGKGAATNLVVTDTFDAGLKHKVAKSPIKRKIVDLQPNQKTRVGVTFDVVSAGRLCHTVKVTADGVDALIERICVNASPKRTEPAPKKTKPVPRVIDPPKWAKLEIRVSPPPGGRVGDRVEFVIEASNTGKGPLANVMIDVVWDDALSVERASRGIPASGDVIWTIPAMGPGDTARRRVEFKCVRAVAQACITTRVSSGTLVKTKRSCIKITAAPAKKVPLPKKDPEQPPVKPTTKDLKVEVAERTAPLIAGGETTYEIRVQNVSKIPHHQLTVTVMVPPEMQLESARGPTRFELKENTATAKPVAELRAGEELKFTVRASAKNVAKLVKAVFRVEVRTKQLALPLKAETTTRIFPKGDQ